MNVLLDVALGAACDLVRTWRGVETVRELRDLFWDLLQVWRSSVPERPSERTVAQHSQRQLRGTGWAGDSGSVPGVAASPGSACYAGSAELSPVLRAMGVAPEVGMGAIRFSLGRTTTGGDRSCVEGVSLRS